ncbi:hypothetical protein ECP32DNA_00163 [Escherichia phage vB_EcoM-ECP32]|uniref:Uncharacterized protein n=1 Tax=Escherichia phage vB_EcoM-ECP32 TaxID=2576874 RepID=A0A4Y5TWQ1_9CAUD|nr:hypothetical protein ECP32DNA_00163 [Escherichia phage vB_EcoM-ECP32]WGL32889.1 hypothetical protein JDPAHGNP_00136 [Escherichia phage S127 BCL3]
MTPKDKPRTDKVRRVTVWLEIIALEILLGVGMYFIAVSN